MRPDIPKILSENQQQIEQAGSAFAESFFLHHPEYDGMFGFAGLGQVNLGQPRSLMLNAALQSLWNRQETFDVDESKVDEVVADVEAFVDNPTVRFRFIAQLLNYNDKVSGESVELGEGLRIRRLTKWEVWTMHRQHSDAAGKLPQRVVVIQELCIAGEADEPKLFGQSESEPTKGEHPSLIDRAKSLLDRGVIGLQASEDGGVGYENLHFFPLHFCPYTPPQMGFVDIYLSDMPPMPKLEVRQSKNASKRGRRRGY